MFGKKFDLIFIIQLYGAQIISWDEARELLEVDKELRKVQKHGR